MLFGSRELMSLEDFDHITFNICPAPDYRHIISLVHSLFYEQRTAAEFITSLLVYPQYT